MEAQRETVAQYRNLTGLEIRREYTEIISGKETNRPVLRNAIRYCNRHDCVLVIAKLDRLARNVGLILYLLENEVKFVIADKPFADRWDILRQAVTDEEEGFKISERTRKALQAAKKRGVQLGKNGKKLAIQNRRKADQFAKKLRPVIHQLEKTGVTTLRGIADELNRREIPTYHGARWHKTTVHNLLRRMGR